MRKGNTKDAPNWSAFCESLAWRYQQRRITMPSSSSSSSFLTLSDYHIREYICVPYFSENAFFASVCHFFAVS